MHRRLVDHVVRPGDVFINVSPKHQSNIEKYGYPGQVLQIINPAEFSELLCKCRAIVSTNFHAAILGLHMGIPTIGAFRESQRSEVRELMIETMGLPTQYLVINNLLTRDVVDSLVQAVRQAYDSQGRRAFIHAQLSAFHHDFETQARYALMDIIGLQHQAEGDQQQRQRQQQQQAGATAEHNIPSFASALLANRDVFKRPVVSGGEPGNHRHHAIDSRTFHGDVIVKTLHTVKYGVLSRLIHNPCVVATLLVVAVAAVALLPSGFAPKRPSADHGKPHIGKGDDDAENPQSGENSCTSSDSEVNGVSEKLERPAARSVRSVGPTAGVAAMSSKMIFMLNFIMWISLSMGSVGHGKAYLSDTHDPVGLLVLQGATGVVVLCLLGRVGVLDLHPGKDMTPAAAQQAGLAALLHTVQALLTNFALFVGGFAMTNALKALEPVVAAAFSYVFLGKPCSGPRMAAVATLVTGIVLLMFEGGAGGAHEQARGSGAGEAGRGSGSGSGSGGGHILTSTFMVLAAVCCNALRNVVIKMGNPIPPHQTLLSCSTAATIVGIVLVLLRLVVRSMDDLSGRGSEDPAAGEGDVGGDKGDYVATAWLRMDGVNAALCFVGYNLASFNLLARLSPVGHAVGNSCKRVFVFASGLVFLGEVMSVRQLGGMAVALFGVLAYNVVGGY